MKSTMNSRAGAEPVLVCQVFGYRDHAELNREGYAYHPPVEVLDVYAFEGVVFEPNYFDPTTPRLLASHVDEGSTIQVYHC